MQLPSNFSGGLAFGNTEIQIHDTNNFSMAGTGNFVVWGWGWVWSVCGPAITLNDSPTTSAGNDSE